MPYGAPDLAGGARSCYHHRVFQDDAGAASDRSALYPKKGSDMESYTNQSISVLRSPNPIQMQRIVDTYRAGLMVSPGQAWLNALAVMREYYPNETETYRVKVLLRSLGFWGADFDWRDQTAEVPPNIDGRWPCLISGMGGMMRASTAAEALGITVDDLVSRVLSAWLDAACDFDGKPLDGVACP
jgi:hypothetical protein